MKRSEVYRSAIEILTRDGWWRGSLVEPDEGKRSCALGACYKALGAVPVQVPMAGYQIPSAANFGVEIEGERYSSESFPELRDEAIAEGFDYQGHSIWKFNDGTSEDRVKAALERAAVTAEAEGE